MQTALCMNPSSLPFPSPLKRGWSTPFVPLPSPKLNFTSTPTVLSAKAAPSTSDPFTVDYTSFVSVFPAEACETIGGDACFANIYPEVKLSAKPSMPVMPVSEPFDREYLDYNNDPKTVFCAEACDDLGGEFCSRDYQRGVY